MKDTDMESNIIPFLAVGVAAAAGVGLFMWARASAAPPIPEGPVGEIVDVTYEATQ